MSAGVDKAEGVLYIITVSNEADATEPSATEAEMSKHEIKRQIQELENAISIIAREIGVEQRRGNEELAASLREILDEQVNRLLEIRSNL